ncbi:MAG: hypothetical protein ACE5IL_17990 [Myxococcota bacterium]
MKRLEDGRIRRTAGEWREILARFDGSGLRASEFCRREGLSRSVFCKWQRSLRNTERREPTGFVELRQPAETGSTPLAVGELELSLPGGVTLRWRS